MSACATHRQVIHENLPLRDPTMAEINRRKRLRESDDVFSEYSKPSKRRLTELIEKEIAALRISYSHPKKTVNAFEVSSTPDTQCSVTEVTGSLTEWSLVPVSAPRVIVEEDSDEVSTEDLSDLMDATDDLSEACISVSEPVKKFLNSITRDSLSELMRETPCPSPSKALVVYDRNSVKNLVIQAIRRAIIKERKERREKLAAEKQHKNTVHVEDITDDDNNDDDRKAAPEITALDDYDEIVDTRQSKLVNQLKKFGSPNFQPLYANTFTLMGWTPQERPELLRYWWPTGCGVTTGFSPYTPCQSALNMHATDNTSMPRIVEVDMSDSF